MMLTDSAFVKAATFPEDDLVNAPMPHASIRL